MPELIFEEPPPIPKKGNLGDLVMTLLRMKEHPNKWVKIGEWPGASGAGNNAAQLRKMMADPDDRTIVGNYELQSRREHYNPKPSGGSILYARFIQEAE